MAKAYVTPEGMRKRCCTCRDVPREAPKPDRTGTTPNPRKAAKRKP